MSNVCRYTHEIVLFGIKLSIRIDSHNDYSFIIEKDGYLNEYEIVKVHHNDCCFLHIIVYCFNGIIHDKKHPLFFSDLSFFIE